MIYKQLSISSSICGICREFLFCFDVSFFYENSTEHLLSFYELTPNNIVYLVNDFHYVKTFKVNAWVVNFFFFSSCYRVEFVSLNLSRVDDVWVHTVSKLTCVLQVVVVC